MRHYSIVVSMLIAALPAFCRAAKEPYSKSRLVDLDAHATRQESPPGTDEYLLIGILMSIYTWVDWNEPDPHNLS
ncbi:hypothetical protein LIA77_00949 [Sarocladium implicatum]|nr:hypothetical protein LIA77_00949 [Sarocladium implicatum]